MSKFNPYHQDIGDADDWSDAIKRLNVLTYHGFFCKTQIKRMKVMKKGRSFEELTQEVKRQLETKKDYIVPTEVMTVVRGEESNELICSVKGMQSFLGINEIAHGQIANHYSIPRKYYEMLKADHAELLAHDLNYFFKNKASKRMIRTLDGDVRAFLGNTYRSLDNWDLLQAVTPMIEAAGCRFEDCQITDKKLYIKAVSERIHTETVGDVVQAGIIISNSEVGQGALSIQPLLYWLSCKNGAVANDYRNSKRHLGGRLHEDAEETTEIFKDDTRRANDRAFWLKVRDTVGATLDEVRFRKMVAQILKSKEVKIDEPVEVIEVCAKLHGFTKEETEGVTNHFITGHDSTLYGLGNAVTRQAQDVESYDRSIELESIGWEVLNGRYN